MAESPLFLGPNATHRPQLKAVLEQEEDYTAEPDVVVIDLEQQLKVTFPPLLKRIWRMGEELKLLSRGFKGQDVGGYLLALRTPHVEHISSTILECHQLFAEDFRRVIPIASHLDGNYLVLDYRFHKQPMLFTYDAELQGSLEQPFIFAAGSFDELIDRGQPGRESHYDHQDKQVSPESLTSLIGSPVMPPFIGFGASDIFRGFSWPLH